jgi:hypothetical protein
MQGLLVLGEEYSTITALSFAEAAPTELVIRLNFVEILHNTHPKLQCSKNPATTEFLHLHNIFN